MRTRSLLGLLAFLLISTIPVQVEAQLGRLKDAAKRAVESEAENQVDRLIREAIRCAIDDPACYATGEWEDGEMIFTDANGELIVDDEGAPIMNPGEAAARAGVDLSAEASAPDGMALEGPGQGPWANYDFVPGDRVLAVTDFSDEEVGDFPRELEYVRGNMEIVEWRGRRLLRATSTSVFKVMLPGDQVPERITIEFDLHGPGSGTEALVVFEEPPAHGQAAVPHFSFGYWGGSGLMEKWHTPLSTVEDVRHREDFVTARMTVDDRHVRAYINERRISNVPSLDLPRGEAIYFVLHARVDQPVFIANVRIAEGGRDLYDKLEATGRVATQGILFDVDSDRIRPESTPTLEEIARMLAEHPVLSIAIEGHTDATGDDAHNQELSQRRAESVRAFLIEHFGISTDRLVAEGFGESNPVDSNDTPEGRHNNRRVELVRVS